MRIQGHIPQRSPLLFWKARAVFLRCNQSFSKGRRLGDILALPRVEGTACTNLRLVDRNQRETSCYRPVASTFPNNCLGVSRFGIYFHTRLQLTGPTLSRRLCSHSYLTVGEPSVVVDVSNLTLEDHSCLVCCPQRGFGCCLVKSGLCRLDVGKGKGRRGCQSPWI